MLCHPFAFWRARKNMMLRGMTWRTALLLLSLLWGGSVFARVDVSPLALTAPLAWSSGDLVYTANYCILSTDEPNPSGNTPVPYRMTALAPLSLASGANQIPYSVAWKDLYTGQTVPLSAGVPTAYVFSGATPGCPLGNNGSLIITIPAATLTVTPPGTYTGTLTFEAGSSGQGRPKLQATVTMTLTVGGIIRVSQLNDMNLGIYNGVNGLSASDSLCVYRNFSGLYGVRVSGQGAAGAFVLVNGASQVPFSVTWNDGSGVMAMAPGVLLSGRANANTSSSDCLAGAANNAVLGVSATAANMNAATVTGPHSGTLTITVEVQ